jgi:hypothetical protein
VSSALSFGRRNGKGGKYIIAEWEEGKKHPYKNPENA